MPSWEHQPRQLTAVLSPIQICAAALIGSSIVRYDGLWKAVPVGAVLVLVVLNVWWFRSYVRLRTLEAELAHAVGRVEGGRDVSAIYEEYAA